MPRYIAFLRAINVGGHRKIAMADLRALFEEAGFERVRTYIQSGNVVFDAPPQPEQQRCDLLQDRILETFGHDVPVLLRTHDELKAALQQFPFEEPEGWKGYLCFLSEKPGEAERQAMEGHSSPGERFRFRNRELYVLLDKRKGAKPIFSNRFAESELGVQATTRNLRTVANLLKLADG